MTVISRLSDDFKLSDLNAIHVDFEELLSATIKWVKRTFLTCNMRVLFSLCHEYETPFLSKVKKKSFLMEHLGLDKRKVLPDVNECVWVQNVLSSLIVIPVIFVYVNVSNDTQVSSYDGKVTAYEGRRFYWPSVWL